MNTSSFFYTCGLLLTTLASNAHAEDALIKHKSYSWFNNNEVQVNSKNLSSNEVQTFQERTKTRHSS